ncbi:hypothetical protein MITS9509_00218 [Synechococcus sp. MIT S9509]|uniref:hypothetical protein n=1 Tax=Synechococcus sp. MIT S9509 TaxID=1801630 RepID=UPI0007BBF7DD|nr:hypothetical protein [Synechococcus sp. MIT S9509]KZR93626.1 hypothetical protein MITS9509_00218 [Synechococcus sp. MIT S9509]
MEVLSDNPDAVPSKAQISYVLRAVTSFAYPEMFQLIQAQCLPISNCLLFVDQYSKVDEIIIGLEFHHDKSEFVDISFFGHEWSEKIQKNIMPEWWSEIEKICLEPSGRSGDFGGSVFSGNDSISGRLANHATSTLQLLGDHIIECEARNGQISVAGVFISLSHEIQEHAKPVFSSAFDVICEIQRAKSESSIKHHYGLKSLISSLVQVLGEPINLGVMVGRSQDLKLIFGCLKSPIDIRKALSVECCVKVSAEFLDQVNSAAVSLLKVSDITFRLCLDMNLQRAAIAPRFCFEIFPSQVMSETRNWLVLDQLADIFGLTMSATKHVRSVHQHLPIGQKLDARLVDMMQGRFDFSQKMVSKHKYQQAAVLSHYKICLELGKDITIKSYAYVKQCLSD